MCLIEVLEGWAQFCDLPYSAHQLISSFSRHGRAGTALSSAGPYVTKTDVMHGCLGWAVLNFTSTSPNIFVGQIPESVISQCSFVKYNLSAVFSPVLHPSSTLLVLSPASLTWRISVDLVFWACLLGESAALNFHSDYWKARPITHIYYNHLLL